MALRNKIAVVTASTDGIGLAIASRLCTEGARVVVSSRKAANVERAVQQLRARGHTVEGTPCNVGSAEHRQQLVQFALDKFGGLDILVNNAGINPTFGRLMDVSQTAWDKLFAVNVGAGFELTKMVVPLMKQRGGGSIVFVSSVAAYKSPPMIAAYGVSKTALLGLTKALAQELVDDHIRVNAIAPGIIKTRFAGALVDDDSADNPLKASIPMRRFGTPDECAGWGGVTNETSRVLCYISSSKHRSS